MDRYKAKMTRCPILLMRGEYEQRFAHCITDNCMAWRKIKTPWWKKLFKHSDTKNEGYCGLARKEGAE